MSNTAREATPIEVLNHDLAVFFNNRGLVLDEEMGKRFDEILAKAKCYEQNYYNNHYVVIDAMLKDAQKENKVLSTQNRIITEYVMFLESQKGC